MLDSIFPSFQEADSTLKKEDKIFHLTYKPPGKVFLLLPFQESKILGGKKLTQTLAFPRDVQMLDVHLWS